MDNSFVANDSKQLKVAHKKAILAWNEEGVSSRVIVDHPQPSQQICCPETTSHRQDEEIDC